MKSKLDKLVANPNFGASAKGHDAGILIYNEKETISYIELIYDDYYEVYLSLFDDYRDYLAYGKASDLDEAKQLAVADLDRKINKMVH